MHNALKAIKSQLNRGAQIKSKHYKGQYHGTKMLKQNIWWLESEYPITREKYTQIIATKRELCAPIIIQGIHARDLSAHIEK